MHAIITGASSGIGAALARELAAGGASLTLVARRREKLEALAGEIDAPTHVVPWDLADPARACDWLPDAEAALGPPDVLVNNAGVQILSPAHAVDVEAGERLLRLNLFTPLRLTRAVLPGMIERGSGTIVDISSMAALAPTPGMLYYNASKGGLAAASEALRGELRDTGVHVVTVYPGIIGSTDMGQQGLDAYEKTALLALQPDGEPSALARMIRRAIEWKSPRVIYPRFNTLARHLPGPTRWLMDRFTPPLKDEGEGSS